MYDRKENKTGVTPPSDPNKSHLEEKGYGYTEV